MSLLFIYKVGNFYRTEMVLLKWKTNEPSEYEACCWSSTPNNLTKSKSTSIFLLIVFSATDPSTTVSLANLSTNVPRTIGFSTAISSTTFLLLRFTFLLIQHLINDMLNPKPMRRSLYSSITTESCNMK